MEGSHGNNGTADSVHSAIQPAATNSEMHNDSAKVTSAPIDLTTPPLTPPRERSPADGPSRKVPPLEPSSTLPVAMEEVDREEEEEEGREGNTTSSNPPALVECEDIGEIAEDVEENMEESEGPILKLEEEEDEEEGEAVALSEVPEQQVLKVEKKEEEEVTELLEGPEQHVLGEEAEEEDVEEKKPLVEGGEVVEEQLLEGELERSEEVSSSTKEEEEPSMLVIDVPEPPSLPSPAAQELGVVLDRKGGSPPPQSGQNVGANGMVSSEPPDDKDDDSDKEEELMEISFELAPSDQDSSTESDNEGQPTTVPRKATPPLLCEGSKVDGGKDISPESSNVVRENHMDEKGKERETPKVRSQEDQKVKERPTQILSDGVLGDEEVGGNSATPSVRQVAKLKRFFTTLQQFGNNMSSEAAEQVQELITALVNGTATIEEFHQEIQTVTNHPLKEFIIPFLRESLDLFRKELKDSSQALSDILGEAPVSKSVGLTPALMDDELPVLPSAKQGSISVPSTPTLPPTTSVLQSSATKSTLSTPTQPHPQPTSANPPAQGYSHFSNAAPIMSTGFSNDFHDHDSAYLPSSSAAPGRKRARRSSNDKVPGSERGPSTSQQSYPNPSKRSRSSYATTPVETAVITSVTSTPTHHPHHPPPAYMHPPPPPPPPPSRPLSHPPPGEAHVGGMAYIPLPQARHGLMAEDWGHIEMMLTSVLGMMETTRQAVAMLKDRVMITQAELERREHDIDSLVQQQVREEAEKMKQQAAEDKQRILLEASKQMREAVAQVRSDMENRMAQAQAVAVREALKETNVQTSSKESCWNCGRQATETCSGCNKARYCGTFCQHKDWGNHMHHCASGLQGHPNVEGSSFTNQQDRDPSSSSTQKSIVMVNDVAVASSNNTSSAQTRIVGVSEKMVHTSAMQAPNNPNIAFIKTEKYTT